MVYVIGMATVFIVGLVLLGVFYKEVASTLAKGKFEYLDGESIVMHLLLGLLIVIVASLGWPLVILFGVGVLIRRAFFRNGS